MFHDLTVPYSYTRMQIVAIGNGQSGNGILIKRGIPQSNYNELQHL